MQAVFAHRFFTADGPLRYFESVDESMSAFHQRQAQALTAAIGNGDAGAVQELFYHGGVHLKMIDPTIAGSTVTVLIKSAFAGDVNTMQVLVNEMADSWPEEVRREYLDQRTSLGLTAYMIACAMRTSPICLPPRAAAQTSSIAPARPALIYCKVFATSTSNQCLRHTATHTSCI